MKKGVPLIVKIRAYLFHAVIASVALVVFMFAFLFLAENSAKAFIEIKRAHDAPHTQIVFSKTACQDDSFIYLKNKHVAGKTLAACDVLMTLPDKEYGKNDIYFTGNLQAGTCAVSKNVAARYGLNKGDYAKVLVSDKKFKVVRILEAQLGLDKEYSNDGIVVLAYDEELTESSYSFISFTTDGDEFPELEKRVFIKEWEKESSKNLAVYAAVICTAFGLTALVCELFLFKSRRRDYAAAASLGKGKVKTYITVWLENALKYLVPLLITVLAFLPVLAAYGVAYALSVLFCAAVWAVIISVYSFITVWRLYRCQVKIKR